MRIRNRDRGETKKGDQKEEMKKGNMEEEKGRNEERGIRQKENGQTDEGE